MDAEKIEWLHRLGIDVWRLRATRQESSQVKTALEITDDTALSNSASLSRDLDNPSVSAHTFSATAPGSMSSETNSSADAKVTQQKPVSNFGSPDSVSSEVSFVVRCVENGRALLVFDNVSQVPSELYKGIVGALSGYEEGSLQEVDFVWPPLQKLADDPASDHSGIESAKRAFRSLAKRSAWKPTVLLVVGDSAATITQDLVDSIDSILKIDNFPSDAASKRHLWQQIVSMS